MITVDVRRTYFTPPGDASGNVLFDFFLAQQQARGFGEFFSISDCGLCGTRLFYGDTKRSSEWVFYSHGFFGHAYPAPLNRAGARVDGHDAWGSGVAYRDVDPGPGFAKASTLEGIPPLTFAVTTDGERDQDVAATEAEDLVRCQNGDPSPLTASECGRFVTTNVRVERVIEQSREGTAFKLTTSFRSLDGAEHALDLLWGENFQAQAAHRPSFQFPWAGDGYAVHDAGDTVAPPQSSPSSFFVRTDSNAPDGDRQWGQGVIVYDRPVEALRFVDEGAFVVPMKLTVPASGVVTLRQVYVMGTTRAEIAGVAAATEDAFAPPSVTITTPGEGASLSTATTDVTGTAKDDRSTPKVTLNGQEVTLGPGGDWTGKVTLKPGPNTLTAVARDAAGNEATATRTVTFTPQAPPPPLADVLAPALSKVSLSATRFRVASGATAVAAATKRGTTVRYTLSETAKVSFAVSRATEGRRVSGRCRRATRRNRRKRACTRYVKAGRTITRSSPAGASTLKFTGRVGTKKLKPGRYRMAIVATDAAGNRSKPRRLKFRIVRR